MDIIELVQIIPKPIKTVAIPRKLTDVSNNGLRPTLSTIVAEPNVTTTFTNEIKQLIKIEWLGKTDTNTETP